MVKATHSKGSEKSECSHLPRWGNEALSLTTMEGMNVNGTRSGFGIGTGIFVGFGFRNVLLLLYSFGNCLSFITFVSPSFFNSITSSWNPVHTLFFRNLKIKHFSVYF